MQKIKVGHKFKNETGKIECRVSMVPGIDGGYEVERFVLFHTNGQVDRHFPKDKLNEVLQKNHFDVAECRTQMEEAFENGSEISEF